MKTITMIFSGIGVLIYFLAVTLGTFAGGSWAALGIAAGALLFLGVWAFERGPAPLHTGITTTAWAVLLIMLLLTIQATTPDVSWHMLVQETSIILPLALLFSPRIISYINVPILFPVTTHAATFAALAFGLEFALGCPLLHTFKGAAASITEYNRGASYLAVFAFPMMAYMWLRQPRTQFIEFIALMLIPVLLTESRATRMAFFVGGSVTLLAHAIPTLTRRSLIGILCVLLALPLIVTTVFMEHHEWVTALPPSWHHRMEIWDYMSYRIFEKPWLGWGLGSSYLLPFQQPHGHLYQYVNQPAGHPHNVILQLWVELGIIGLTAGVIAAIALLQKTKKLAAPIIPFALGAWAAGLCISSVAYSFWDDSLFALFALVILAFIILNKQYPHQETNDGRTA